MNQSWPFSSVCFYHIITPDISLIPHTSNETDTDTRGKKKKKFKAEGKENQKSQKSSGLQLSDQSPE